MDAEGHLRALGAVLRDGAVVHAGDAPAEAAQALTGEGALVVPLLATSAMRIRGADRAAFLHGQLSNTIRGLPVGAVQPVLQLDARGRIVGEGTLAVREDDHYLAIEDGRGPEVRASLERHVVFEDVAIDDLEGEWAVLTVQGSASAAAVQRALGVRPEPGRYARAAFADASVLAVERRRGPAGGFDLHLPTRHLAALLTGLREAGARMAGERALTLARGAAGVASAARDGGAGVLPQEVGLERAVSYDKGCYLGQEIMARIEARGAVRRRLARVRLDGDAGPPERGGDRRLWLGDRDVGWLGEWASAPDARRLALAVVRHDLPADAVMTVQGAEVRFIASPVLDAEAWRTTGAVQPPVPSGTDL